MVQRWAGILFLQAHVSNKVTSDRRFHLRGLDTKTLLVKTREFQSRRPETHSYKLKVEFPNKFRT